MSDDQLMCLFDVDRDDEGNAVIVPPKPTEPTPEQVFRRKCYINGVTNPDTADRLWLEERARRAEREKADKGKRSRR